jgi:WD40 repeat protein
LIRAEALGSLNSAAFSPDGNEIVTASPEGNARVWDARTSRLLATVLEPGAAGVQTAVFARDGRSILTSSADGSARVWDLTSGRAAVGLLGHSRGVSDAEFSPDGSIVVTAGQDGTAKLWDATPREQLAALSGPGGERFVRAAFSPDGSLIAAAGAESARVFETRTGRCSRRLPSRTSAGSSASPSAPTDSGS